MSFDFRIGKPKTHEVIKKGEVHLTKSKEVLLDKSRLEQGDCLDYNKFVVCEADFNLIFEGQLQRKKVYLCEKYYFVDAINNVGLLQIIWVYL